MCCCGLASVGNKEPHSYSLAPPLSQWDGEKNQKEKAKLMGCDKNSLPGQQREKKITTTVLIKKIYSMKCCHHPMLSLLLSSKMPFLHPAPHLNTEHDITWYRTSHVIGCLGQPNQLLLKINPIPAEPRTCA